MSMEYKPLWFNMVLVLATACIKKLWLIIWYVYLQQEDVEESARSELWREELIEEIEQKVGGLRELEEAVKKEEQLVK